MSNRISLIRGTTKTLAIDLVDGNGEPIPLDKLVGATATFLMRVQPTDLTNVLAYDTTGTPSNLAFEIAAPVLDLTFLPNDTSAIPIALYFYQVQVTLTDGSVYDVIPWDLLDLNLGGAASPAPPSFENTVKVTADYPQPGAMQYVTPGGSPIVGAQVRVYLKSDYDAGNLATPVGVTTTDAGGNWLNPILVVTGYTYTARLEKPYEFGPDTLEFFA